MNSDRIILRAGQLERLVGAIPPYDDHGGCIYCNSLPEHNPDGRFGWLTIQHAEDCAWQAIRKEIDRQVGRIDSIHAQVWDLT